MLLSLFAVVPASSSEAATSESLDLKEIYVKTDKKIQVKHSGSMNEISSIQPYKSYQSLIPAEGNSDFSQTRLYLLHQCLKLLD